MIWHLFIELIDDPSTEENFISYFALNEKSKMDQMFTLLYFTFTSLSTVGLGDYHPRSNYERAVGAFLLLFGVAITSFVIENVM